MSVYTCRAVLGKKGKLLEKQHLLFMPNAIREKGSCKALWCGMVKLNREKNIPKSLHERIESGPVPDSSLGWVTTPSLHQLQEGDNSEHRQCCTEQSALTVHSFGCWWDAC